MLNILLMFAVIKLVHLLDRYNPNISQFLQRSFYTETDMFNTNKNNFRMAFTLENYLDSTTKIDPRYVKPFVRVNSSKDGVDTYTELATYPCTDADLDKFNPVEQSSAYRLQKYRSGGDPEKTLLCLDWDNLSVDLHGKEFDSQQTHLDVMFLPCNHRLT